MNEFLERMRARYPQYAVMSDQELAQAVYQRFYSDLEFSDFAARIGLEGETQQAPEMPDDPMRAAQQRLAESEGSAVGDFARMAAQGATFGFADEMAGLGAGTRVEQNPDAPEAIRPFSLRRVEDPSRPTREEAVAGSRQRVEDLRTLAPGASIMSEIAGGVGIPALGGASVARGLTRPGAGVLARSGAGAAGGAVGGGGGGALIGAGEAEGGLGERVRGGLIGGAIGTGAGAALGGVLPAAGAGLATTGRFAREVLQPGAAGRSEARRRLRRVFEEAGIDADDVLARMDELGPDAVIADLDPALAREARNAVNQAASLERAGGPVDRLAQRTEQRGERLAEAFRRESGVTETMESGKQLADRAIREVRRQHYGPLEDAFPRVEGPNVAQALQDARVARVAARVAPDIVPDERAVAQAVEQGIPEAQARQMLQGRPPSFTELQDIRLDLQDAVTEAQRAGRPNASRRAREVFETFSDAMEQDVPGFREAQNAYRIASQTMEAFDIGASMQTKTARQIREAMADLPPEAHDAFRTGLLQRWEERLLSREGTSGAVNQILRAGSEMRDQIQAAFGSEEGFQRFLQTRDLERTFRLTESAVQGNSTTARQALDAIDSMPTTRSQLLNRVWDALFSPGEARRVQAETIGQQLLGRDAPGVARTIQPSPFGFGQPGLGGGTGGAAGASAVHLFSGPGTLLERLATSRSQQ